MYQLTRILIALACSFISLCCSAQTNQGARQIVLPSPKLIHCRATTCSQLWAENPTEKGDAYPAQVLTDIVDGEIVGLTAIYDKSVSTKEVLSTINRLYGKWQRIDNDVSAVWRVEPEQLAIQAFKGKGGTTEVMYLKFGTYQSLVPSAHIYGDK